MDINVNLQGLQKAIKEVSKYEHTKRQAIKDVINESALNIQRGAKRRCVVDTGRLRSSIAMQPYNDGLTLQVGSKVHYAQFIEFGTGKFVEVPAGVNVPATGRQTPWQFPLSKGGVKTGDMVWTSGTKPRPFLFPASEEEKPRLIKALEGALKK